MKHLLCTTLLATVTLLAPGTARAAEPTDDELLRSAAQRVVMYRETKGGLGDSYFTGLPELQAACEAIIDKRLAAGAPADELVETNWAKATPLAQFRAEYCAVVDAAAARRAAKRAEALAAAQPYVDAGIAGDKLELIIGRDLAWVGKGGAYLHAPAQLAKAALLFEVLIDDAGLYTVRRHQFRGNTRVKVSERTYRTNPGSRAYR